MRCYVSLLLMQELVEGLYLSDGGHGSDMDSGVPGGRETGAHLSGLHLHLLRCVSRALYLCHLCPCL